MTGHRKISPIVAWGLLVLLSAGAFVGLIEPALLTYRSEEVSLAARARVLGYGLAMVARTSEIEARIHAVEVGIGSARLVAGSGAVAGAALQSLVKDKAGHAGLAVDAIFPMDPLDATEAVPEIVRLRLRASGNLAATQAFLHGLETGVEVVAIDSMSVTTTSAAGLGQLEVDVTVSAPVGG